MRDETNVSDEDWEDFGNGGNNCDNFGVTAINNNGGETIGKNFKQAMLILLDLGVIRKIRSCLEMISRKLFFLKNYFLK